MHLHPRLSSLDERAVKLSASPCNLCLGYIYCFHAPFWIHLPLVYALRRTWFYCCLLMRFIGHIPLSA